MRVNSGKHQGKLAEILILKEPDYIEWCLENHPNPAFRAGLKRLIEQFDAKPFVVECASHSCSEPATKASAYRNTSDLMFWCEDCDPYNSGAREGVLTTVRTFGDAMRHVNWTCTSGHRGEKRAIIKVLAEAKGAPARLTEKAAEAFFN
jgi:hypothetical protein